MALHDLPHRKLTYEDYLLIPEDGLRHEIIDGEHYVTASPFTRHQRLVRKLVERLGPSVDRLGLGEIFLAPYDLLLSEHDVVQPDLMFVSRERLGIITEKNAQGAPDLVIEILSEGTRRHDETTKFRLYERVGVLEYWMFDPLRKTVTVYRQVDGRFRRMAELSAPSGDTLSSKLLPGIEIPLAEVFA